MHTDASVVGIGRDSEALPITEDRFFWEQRSACVPGSFDPPSGDLEIGLEAGDRCLKPWGQRESSQRGQQGQRNRCDGQ